MYWYPQTLFTAEQACRFVFVVTARLLQTRPFLTNKHVCVSILTACTYFRKHQIETERKSIQNGGWNLS